MNRDKPEIQEIEWDDDECSLYEFYDEEDDVIFYENDEVICAFDYEDPRIMVQVKETFETKMMNLLFARKHYRNLYDRWFEK